MNFLINFIEKHKILFLIIIIIIIIITSNIFILPLYIKHKHKSKKINYKIKYKKYDNDHILYNIDYIDNDYVGYYRTDKDNIFYCKTINTKSSNDEIISLIEKYNKEGDKNEHK